MASFAPTSAETLADQQRYVASGLTEVACLDCLARVGVRKNSEHMTSVQWTTEAREPAPTSPGGCPRVPDGPSRRPARE